MKILAWQYPEKRNLQYYVEHKRLYPVSIIPGINKKNRIKLFTSDIITVQDLIALEAEDIMRLLSTDRKQTAKILDEVSLLVDQ